MCRVVHLQTCNIPCSIPNMLILKVRRFVFDASMRWLVRLRCEVGEDVVLSGSTAVVQYPHCLHRNHEPIRDTCGSWTVEGLRRYARIGSRPQFLLLVVTGTAFLDVAVTCFTCQMMLEAQRRRPFHLALGLRARPCSFQAQSRNPCAWGSRCSLGSVRRTVDSGFHPQ